MGELLVAAVDKVRSDVERDDVTVAVTVPAERLVAALEAERFGQIVEHLVRNGFQYAERRIDVAVLGPGDGVPGDRFRLVVRDDGAGIGRKRQKRIFDPFYTTGATAAGGGLGLGLPIVRNLADRMGASIEVDSEEGGGAEFRIDFPYRAADEPLAPVAEGGSPQSASAGDGRLAVLLVENDADFADFFFRHLSEQYDVQRAGDVRQAVETLRRGRFAAVVCNAAARGIDGEGLCAAIRADAQLACLPVVLITADAASAARVGALQAGADVCLAMPLSADCLEEQIRSLVRRRDELRLTYSKMPYRPLGEGRGAVVRWPLHGAGEPLRHGAYRRLEHLGRGYRRGSQRQPFAVLRADQGADRHDAQRVPPFDAPEGRRGAARRAERSACHGDLLYGGIHLRLLLRQVFQRPVRHGA